MLKIAPLRSFLSVFAGLLSASLLIFLIWDMFVIGGTAYIVFWKGHSAWWFLLALVLCR